MKSFHTYTCQFCQHEVRKQSWQQKQHFLHGRNWDMRREPSTCSRSQILSTKILRDLPWRNLWIRENQSSLQGIWIFHGHHITLENLLMRGKIYLIPPAVLLSSLIF